MAKQKRPVRNPIYVRTVSSLRMTLDERGELVSPRHALTALVNKTRTICHVLGFDFGPDIITGHMRVGLPGKILRTATDYELERWLSVRLRNLIPQERS